MAGAIAVVLLLAVAIILVREFNRPVSLAKETRLEGALRAGTPEFDQNQPLILVTRVMARPLVRLLGDASVEITATVQNTTARRITALEMRGTVVDAGNAPVRERTKIIPLPRNEPFNPGEKIEVMILVEGVKPQPDLSHARMEVTGFRFE